MLSCQWWAFWKFSAASANLWGQSTDRSEAGELRKVAKGLTHAPLPQLAQGPLPPPHPRPRPTTTVPVLAPEPLPFPTGLSTPSVHTSLARHLGLVPAASSSEAPVPVSTATCPSISHLATQHA